MLRKIRSLISDDLILVYQMGKVASTGIVRIIRSHGLKCYVVYSFNRHPVDSIFKNYKSAKFYRPMSQRLKYKLKYKLIGFLLKKRKNLKVLSIVREPVARNMSFFFQDIQIPIMDIHKEKNTVDSNEISIKELIENFFKKFNHTQGIDWFDDDFRKNIGIDVYSEKFDVEKGYSRFTKNGIDVMIARMENLSELDSELGDFLGLADFRVPQENTGSDKWYSGVYKEFKSKIQFDEKYIDKLYDTRFMNHFYSKEEIIVFRKNYLGKQGESGID